MISRSQLLAIGLGRGGIENRVRQARLWPLYSRAYAVGRAGVSRRGIWIAALLSAAPDSALSHRSAGSADDLLVETSDEVDVTTLGRRGKRRPGVRIHRPRELASSDLTIVAGLPCTALPRTLLDLAADLNDRRISALLERLQQAGRYDHGGLESVLARAGGHRGARRLLRCLPRREAPVTRSELERRFLDLCRDHDLPEPATNVVVEGYEVDAYWPDARLVVELDGYIYHRTRRAREADAERDVALKAGGFDLVRFTWTMVTDKRVHTAERLGTLLLNHRGRRNP